MASGKKTVSKIVLIILSIVFILYGAWMLIGNVPSLWNNIKSLDLVPLVITAATVVWAILFVIAGIRGVFKNSSGGRKSIGYILLVIAVALFVLGLLGIGGTGLVEGIVGILLPLIYIICA